MKKLFVAVLAIAGLVACNNEETVRVQGPAPIAFDGSFVETRATEAVDPSITTEKIDGFDVWGFMDEAAGQILDREHVTGTKGNFTYVNTQYWVPEHDYYFAATAPAQSKNIVLTTPATGEAAKLGLGVVDFTVTDGAEDFLYSAVGPIAAPEAGATTVDPVKFEFNHMLSKVKFTFTNGFDNELATIDVTNVRMVVPSKGTIKLDQTDWWSTNQWVLGTETVELAFGDACSKLAMGASEVAADERIVLPADATQTYAITFDVVYYQGAVEAYRGTKNGIVEDVALEIGKAYNFKVELNAKNIMADGSELLPIVFDVEEVKEWVNGGETDVNVLPTLTVDSAEDVTLDADYAIAGSVKLNGANLDGAGYTLFAESTPADNGLIRPAGDVTVENVTVAAEGQTTADGKTLRAFYINNGGTYVLNNVTTTGTGYAINVNVSSAAVVLNVTDSILEGWTSYGTSTTATFTGVTFKSGVYNTYRPYGTTVCENCEFTDMIIDLGSQGAANTITFKNCTFNGAALTAADLTNAEGKNVTIE